MNQTALAMEIISSKIDPSQIEYDSLIKSLIKFIKNHINPLVERDLSISVSQKKNVALYTAYAEDFLQKKISEKDLLKGRVEAWKEFDENKLSTEYRNTIRVIICTLYDRESAEFENYGAESIIETFLSCLEDLRSHLPKLFAHQMLEDF